MIHETFTVDGTPDMEVRVESGRVEIRQCEAGRVDVRVDTKTPGFIVEQRGNAILVSRDDDAPWTSRARAFVVIEAPEGTDLRLLVASASVTADLPLGKVTIKTASGDAEVAHADTLEVKTASGDLSVGTVDHALRFTSASGDLRVSGSVGGSLDVSTASGDAHIEQTDAVVEMSSASGDAYISRFTGRSANFKAMSGDVHLSIPAGTSVELDTTLLSGKLRLPDTDPVRRDAERQTSIRAKLVSGDFTIVRI